MRIQGLSQKVGVLIGASGLAMTALAGLTASPARATNFGAAIYSNASGGAIINSLSENCTGLLNGQTNNVVIGTTSSPSDFYEGNVVHYIVTYPTLPATTTSFSIRNCVVVEDATGKNLGTLGEAQFDNAPNTSPFTFDVTIPTDALVVPGNQLCTVSQTVEQQSKAAAQQNRKTDVFCQTIVGPVLTLAKTANASPVTAGGAIGFTIDLTNTGVGTATGVTLTDPLPAAPGVDWSATPPAVSAINGLGTLPSCTISGAVGAQTLNCTAVSLPATKGYQVVVTSPTTAATTGANNSVTLNNTANAAATNAAAPAPASASVTVTKAAANLPNLQILKQADPVGPVTAGNPIGFDIFVTNTGSGDATNVTVTDTLPTVATWGTNPTVTAIKGGNTPTCTVIGAGQQTLSCTTVTLAGGGKGFEIHLSATTPSSLTGQVVSNTASATDSEGDNVSSTATVTVLTAPRAVLTLSKTANPSGPVTVGTPIGFDIAVSNVGTVSATNVKITDTLPSIPAGLTWTVGSVTPLNGGPSPVCTVTGGTTLSCATVASLAPNTGFDVYVSSPTAGLVPVNGSATVTNTANASADNAPSPSPATASVTINGVPFVIPPPPPGTPVLTLAKTADSASVTAPAGIGFVVTAANAGGADASNFTLNDPLPSNTGLGSWSVVSVAKTGTLATAPTCSITGGTLSCPATGNMTLPAGGGFSVHIVNSATSNATGLVTNTATESATNATSPSPASATVNVVGPVTPGGTPQPLPPDPTIVKVPDSTSGAPGGNIGYSITVTNPGVITTAAVVTDTLPANLAWSIDKQPAFGPACTITSGKLQCGPVNLPVNSTWSVHVTAPLTTANCGQINNTAVLTASNLATPRSASAAAVTVVCPLAVLGTQITPTTAAAAPAAKAAAGGPTLAFTGANTNLWMLIGLTLVVNGLILVILGRKRQEANPVQAG
ncbi:MAG TPA: hypothetical protein VFP54_01480 [Acidimicrobiales bacterium]|nr:hypothetical protein [Acidimicrobiales bacterium]